MIQRTDTELCCNGELIATLTYSTAARIWRINLGRRRRKEKNQLGFYINPISGYWSKEDDPDETPEENGTPESTIMNKVPNQRIVPFVEDHRNVLILTPAKELDDSAMATLEAALERSIEQTFQIEESELVAESLPSGKNRRAILFYEASEGGAGVLSRIASEPGQLALAAAQALRLMHYQEPKGGWATNASPLAEERRPDGSAICEAGCYQCLLSYYNQPDHKNIDRRNPDVISILTAIANSNFREKNTPTSPSNDDTTPASQLLRYLQRHKLRLPTEQRKTFADKDGNAFGEADAWYKEARTAVFLSPPPAPLRRFLTDKGVNILLFPNDQAQWPDFIAHNEAVFGRSSDNT